MDIVKRAYLQVYKEWPKNAEIIGFRETMKKEMIRWIKARVYSKRDWPSREFGPLPAELQSKKKPTRKS